MLIGALIGVVVVVAILVAAVLRSRSHDDEHSVEHYHRQMHTLEELRAHPSENKDGNGIASAYPASAFRVSGTSTVRLTEVDRPIVPPVPPPPVPPGRPITFGDDGDEVDETDADEGVATPEGSSKTEKVTSTFMSGTEDRAMHGINHRPRRLAGPAAAVAAVLVLIVVLILAGVHTSTPPHKGKADTTATTTRSHPRGGSRHPATSLSTTTTTAAPAVSAPLSATPHGATYQVSGSSYSLALSATSGECWVDATNPANGSVLYTATLFPGQSHTITATSSVTVIAGAPGAFAATVNGAPVALPAGNQAPFTLQFQTATTPA